MKDAEDRVGWRQTIGEEEENGFMLSQQFNNNMLGLSLKKNNEVDLKNKQNNSLRSYPTIT